MGTRNDGHDRRPRDCRENVGYTLELGRFYAKAVLFLAKHSVVVWS